MSSNQTSQITSSFKLDLSKYLRSLSKILKSVQIELDSKIKNIKPQIKLSIKRTKKALDVPVNAQQVIALSIITVLVVGLLTLVINTSYNKNGEIRINYPKQQIKTMTKSSQPSLVTKTNTSSSAPVVTKPTLTVIPKYTKPTSTTSTSSSTSPTTQTQNNNTTQSTSTQSQPCTSTTCTITNTLKQVNPAL